MRPRLLLLRLMPALLLLLSAARHEACAQVKARHRTERLGRRAFNYPDSAAVRTKKIRNNRIVYSDREANWSYEEPYLQHRRAPHAIGTPFYVIGRKNGACRVVEAAPDLLGKPKSVFKLLYNGRRHFKEPARAPYAGWIPEEQLQPYGHARLHPANNRPIRYRIGISRLQRLGELHRFFRGDTLQLYGDPLLQHAGGRGVATGAIVYLYKFDPTGQAALISDAAALDDPARQLLGWIPADCLAPVGQQELYRADGAAPEALCGTAPGLQPDTLTLHPDPFGETLLFDLDGNRPAPGGRVRLNYPVGVWDSRRNRLINIKGGDLPLSEVRRLEQEQRQVGIHVLFHAGGGLELSPYLHLFQQLELCKRPGYAYTYSAAQILPGCPGRYLAPTDDLAAWLEFIQAPAGEPLPGIGLEGALRQLLLDAGDRSFAKQLVVLIGTGQPLELPADLPEQLARRSVRLLVVQTEGGIETSSQEFLLQAKELLDRTAAAYSDHIADCIVDHALDKPGLFRSIEAPGANLYLFDAPENSLAAGGLLFPKGRSRLESRAFGAALDSLLAQTFRTDSLLLHALKSRGNRLGILRSRLNPDLAAILDRSPEPGTPQPAAVDRNSVNDVYYLEITAADTLLRTRTKGVLLDDTELAELLRHSRDLLPAFAGDPGREELQLLRRLCRQQRKLLNRNSGRKLLGRRDPLARLFYLETGLLPGDSLLHALRLDELRPRRLDPEAFGAGWRELRQRMLRLEELYRRQQLETLDIAGKNYYFIPNQYLL